MVRLLVEQLPDGPTNHNIWGRTAAGEWVGLGNVAVYTWAGQWIDVNIAVLTPVRYIVVSTTAGPSWVAWREIQVYEGLKPQNVGDVVGRDLAYPVIGLLGHIGFWDGDQVLEVLNESTVAQQNSYANFISRSAAWDPAFTNIPPFSIRTCFLSTCNWDAGMGNDRVTQGSRWAMALRAYQIIAIGSDYTYTAWPTLAHPRMYDSYTRQYTPAQRGLYRCDTFVRELFGFTNTPYGQYWMWSDANYPVERVVSNDPQSWKTNINSLFTATTVLPAAIYSRIKGF